MRNVLADVLAFMSFPKDHRLKIHSMNPLDASTARSSAAPMSLAFSPTKMRSSGSIAPPIAEAGRQLMAPAPAASPTHEKPGA
jgi:hypothetical protein